MKYFEKIVNHCWVVDWSAEEGWHIDIDFLFPLSEIYSEKEEEEEEIRKKKRDFILDIVYTTLYISIWCDE